MVIRSNVKKYALISVFDKSKLKFLCENLNKQNIGFISTGSTFKKIRSLGFDCKEVSKLINFKATHGAIQKIGIRANSR